MTPAPNATRAAGRVSVDAAALETFMREAIHLIDDVAPDSDGRRFVANLASELDATAAPLPPTVVDAGTLAQWRNDADRLDKSAGRSDSVIVSGDCRSGAFALRAACDAIETMQKGAME